MSGTCATLPCGGREHECCLPGGCVFQRFGPQTTTVRNLKPASDLRDDAKAFNGTKSRQIRDPRFMKRKRKALR